MPSIGPEELRGAKNSFADLVQLLKDKKLDTEPVQEAISKVNGVLMKVTSETTAATEHTPLAGQVAHPYPTGLPRPHPAQKKYDYEPPHIPPGAPGTL
jgi:hypothetical protein